MDDDADPRHEPLGRSSAGVAPCENLSTMSAAPRTTDRRSRARGLLMLLALLTLIALAGLLAACGDDADEPGARVASISPQRLALFADRTTATDGVRMSLHQTMTIPGEGTVPATAEGRFDTKRQRGEMTLSMDVASLGGGDVPGGGALKQRMIFDGLTFYMSSPMLRPLLPSGKRWLKIDLDTLGKQAGLDLGALMSQGGGQDPTQVLAYLKAASGDVERVGTDTVRGVATTHYKATIDFRKVPDSAPAGERAAVRRSMEQLIDVSGTSTAPIEVWIGQDGLARRIVTTTTTGTAAQRIKLRQRIELYDFGTKVDVKPPPASAVLDAGDFGGLPPGAAPGSLFG
jgi:hypothetical protein